MSTTLILSRKDVASLLTIEECIVAVEAAFKNFAEGKMDPPKVLSLHAPGGGLHVKAGIIRQERNYIVAKMNSNFPGNATRFGLPTIQGAVAVFNGENGALLALMDSIEITIVRTGAATGVAAKYLSRKNSRSMTIYGCGNQGLISFKAISASREIDTVYLVDVNRSQAEKLKTNLEGLKRGLTISCPDDVKTALRSSDIIVTCTTSKVPILDIDDVRRGAFIAAVGCDSDEKSEIHPRLISSSKLVTDLTEQCAAFGDLHQAIKLGQMEKSSVHAELGQVIAGLKPGREDDDEIIVFDSTGTALQDVAAASIVLARAIANGIGMSFDFQQFN